jgi:hypothetical protein
MILSRIKVFFFEPHVAVSFFVVVVAQILTWWNIVRSAVGESLVLHYNITFGVDYVGSLQEGMLLPITGLGFFVINRTLAFFLFARFPKLSTFLCVTDAVVMSMLAGASFLIVFLNT